MARVVHDGEIRSATFQLSTCPQGLWISLWITWPVGLLVCMDGIFRNGLKTFLLLITLLETAITAEAAENMKDLFYSKSPWRKDVEQAQTTSLELDERKSKFYTHLIIISCFLIGSIV